MVYNVVKWFDHFHDVTLYKGDENPIEKLCLLIESQDNLSNEIDSYIINLFVIIHFFQRIKLLIIKEPLVLILMLSTRGLCFQFMSRVSKNVELLLNYRF